MANADKEQPRGLEFSRACLTSREEELCRYYNRSSSSATTAQLGPTLGFSMHPADLKTIINRKKRNCGERIGCNKGRDKIDIQRRA